MFLYVILFFISPFLAFWLVIYKIYTTNRMIATAKKLPGIPVFPISEVLPVCNGPFGHLPLLKRYLKEGVDPGTALITMIHACHQIEPVSSNGLAVLWLGPVPIIGLFRPETAETLLSSNTLIAKSIQYRFIMPWLGTGLLTAKGAKWRSRRKMLTPSFHFKILENFVPIMAGQMDQLIAIMNGIIDKKAGLVDDLSQLMLMCALDVICETAMGIKVNAQINPNSQYVSDIHFMGLLLMKRTLNPLLYLDFIFALSPTGMKLKRILNRLHAFTDRVIQQRKEEILREKKLLSETGDKKVVDSNSNESFFAGTAREKKPFMDTLIEEHLKNPSEMTLKDIREEVDTFMFEGHDTTAWGATWSIYLVGLYPDVQQKIHDELYSIFGDDTERPITLEDLREMKYIECVAKEAQRLFPSVPLYARTLEEDMPIYVKTLDQKVTIPSGINVVVFPSAVHRSPEHWPNPEKFMPERFFPENIKGQHPYAFVPFSAGPRNCIGQKFATFEEKAIIASVFRRFKVRSLEPHDKIEILPALILKSQRPLKVVLSRR